MSLTCPGGARNLPRGIPIITESHRRFTAYRRAAYLAAHSTGGCSLRNHLSAKLSLMLSPSFSFAFTEGRAANNFLAAAISAG